ncbi:MAG: hypothetical protein HY815_08210 [Candidatus Riflebacteria bacterium]|nr:hypothetical protein [Candidatus Riflebacteria bacterium]
MPVFWMLPKDESMPRASTLALAVGLAFMVVGEARGVDFGYIRVRGSASSSKEGYGAVTLVNPFRSEKEGSLPLWLLADRGDFLKPWLRAKHVAQLLPKAAELLLHKGEILKVGPDEDGNPSIYVGPPSRPISQADLKLVSVLPGDKERFEREPGERRNLSCLAIAHYWKYLLQDMLVLFVRYPYERDRKVLSQLNLAGTQAGLIFKRVLIEVGVLLQWEDQSEAKAGPDLIRGKMVEALQTMSREHWAQLTGLAFRVPADLRLPSEAGGPPDDPVERIAPSGRSRSGREDDGPPLVEGRRETFGRPGGFDADRADAGSSELSRVNLPETPPCGPEHGGQSIDLERGAGER